MSNRTENSQTDHELVSRALRKDRDAFTFILKSTEGLVAQIVCKMVMRSADQKDLVQDIYIKVFKGLAGFKFQSKLSTWIAQIAYNTCLSYLEKHHRTWTSELQAETVTEEGLVSLAATFAASNAEAMMAQKELSRILSTEIQALSPVYRILITLYHREEMSYDEIAEISGLPVGTVKSYLFRARKTLRESLLSKYKKEEL